jgi:hypothetical protein
MRVLYIEKDNGYNWNNPLRIRKIPQSVTASINYTNEELSATYLTRNVEWNPLTGSSATVRFLKKE